MKLLFAIVAMILGIGLLSDNDPGMPEWVAGGIAGGLIGFSCLILYRGAGGAEK